MTGKEEKKSVHLVQWQTERQAVVAALNVTLLFTQNVHHRALTHSLTRSFVRSLTRTSLTHFKRQFYDLVNDK